MNRKYFNPNDSLDLSDVKFVKVGPASTDPLSIWGSTPTTLHISGKILGRSFIEQDHIYHRWEDVFRLLAQDLGSRTITLVDLSQSRLFDSDFPDIVKLMQQLHSSAELVLDLSGNGFENASRYIIDILKLPNVRMINISANLCSLKQAFLNQLEAKHALRLIFLPLPFVDQPERWKKFIPERWKKDIPENKILKEIGTNHQIFSKHRESDFKNFSFPGFYKSGLRLAGDQ